MTIASSFERGPRTLPLPTNLVQLLNAVKVLPARLPAHHHHLAVQLGHPVLEPGLHQVARLDHLHQEWLLKGNALKQEVTCHVEGSILQVAAEALLLGILPPVTKICPLCRMQSAEEEIIGLDKVKLVHRQLVVSKTKLLFFSSPPTTANLVSEMATVQAYLAPAPGIFGPSLHARVSPTGRNSLDLESFLPPKMNVPTGRTTVWVQPSSLVSLALKFCQARSLNWKQLVGE